MLQAEAEYYQNVNPAVTPNVVENPIRVKKTIKTVNYTRKIVVKFGVAIFVYCLLLVFLCIKSASLGYEIEALKNDIHQLDNSNKQFEYEISQASSLDRIEEVAVRDLGMYKADLKNSFTVDVQNSPVLIASGVKDVSKRADTNKPLQKLYSNLSRLAQKD